MSKSVTRSTLFPDVNSCQCTVGLPRGDMKKKEIFITHPRHYCHFINALQARRHFLEWPTISFDLNIYFGELFYFLTLEQSPEAAVIRSVGVTEFHTRCSVLSLPIAGLSPPQLKATRKQILPVCQRSPRAGGPPRWLQFRRAASR